MLSKVKYYKALYNFRRNVYIIIKHFSTNFIFDVTECRSKNPIYFSVSESELGTKSYIFCVRKNAPKYKIQLVSCELSPKYLLGISALEDVISIGTYIF